MTWLTWRQMRLQTVVVASAASAAVAVLLLTAPALSRMHSADARTFLARFGAQTGHLTTYYAGCVAVLVLPAVIGAFWGAPLIARELEAGTYRLAWTQAVSRTRWLVVKLGAVGLVACGLTAATSLAMSRWSDPIDAAARAGSDGPVGVFELTRMSPVIFDTRGVAPVGFAALAFVLGAAIGALVRRTVPAMALTLAVFVAVQVAVPLWVRPHLIPPKQATVTITAGNLHGLQMTGNGSTLRRHLLVDVTRPGAWALANHTVDAAGRVVEAPAYVEDCLPIALGGPAPANPTRADLTERRLAAARADACIARLAQEGYRQQVTFQPADRYWALQWREAGVYLVAASLLAGFCFWRVRRLG